MQSQQQASRFVWQRFVAKVFSAQFGKAKFFRARNFPQEIEVDLGGGRLRIA